MQSGQLAYLSIVLYNNSVTNTVLALQLVGIK